MSYTTELTDDCLGIVHHGHGVVTGADLLAGSVSARQLVQNTENFNYEVVDLSGVTELQVTPDDLEQIVAQDHLAAEWRPHAMVVLITPSDAAYKMATEWEEQVRDLGWTIHISREREEGMRWLAAHREQARQDLLAEKKKSRATEEA